ncbi:hypothetical protein IVB35_14635 [Bradyrhizobium sp. 30]|nr:hypothetical protein [Bradyrhizobium sp. 30]
MEQGFIPSLGRGQLLWFAGVPPATYRESFMFGRKAYRDDLSVLGLRLSGIVCGGMIARR